MPLMILTTLKELFTFTPDPEGLEVNRVADVAVASYALKEGEIHEKRASICGCRNCKNDLKDADDRIRWAVNQGRWRLKHNNERVKVRNGA